jgi:5-methylcytosine-specific restriction protein A
LAIPGVDRLAIERALDQFDRELRSTASWSNWEYNEAQLYAIEHDGRRYPPKKIVSMATGEPVAKFSGGRSTNSYLTGLGFTIVPVTHANGASGSPQVRFQRGNLYDRRSEINVPFGGSRQSGISASNRTAAIFIFTGESGEQYGYRDGFDSDGVWSLCPIRRREERRWGSHSTI